MAKKMTKKRKIAAFSAATALVGAVCVGGTLAYFTDSDSASNVVTTGNVNITLYDQLAEEHNGTLDSVMPNQKIQNVITVKNEGKSDAFLRLAVDYSASEISGADIMSTFVGTYAKASGTENFDTEEEAKAAVAAYEAKGVTASYEAKEVTTVETTSLVTQNTTGSQKCWYDQIEVYGDVWWRRLYLKKNLNGTYVIQGEKYVPTSASLIQDGAEAGIIETVSDNVNYVLVQNDADGYVWERQETVTATKYVVTYEGYKYVDSGISEDAWKAINDEQKGICYFYYNEILEVGETAEFLDSLHIPASWGNAYADKSITLEVTAEAVQSEYLEKEDGTYAQTAEEAFAIVTNIEPYEGE